MQIMDQFGAAPGAESVRMPDGTERTLAAEHAAAILVNEQPAFRVVCTPELLPQLALGRLLTEGWITAADEVERVAVCAQGLKISVQLRHPLAAAEQAGQEVPSCCTDTLPLAECVLFTSGRVPVDMVRKAIRAGVPALVSKSMPTVQSLELAEEYGLKLLIRQKK